MIKDVPGLKSVRVPISCPAQTPIPVARRAKGPSFTVVPEAHQCEEEETDAAKKAPSITAVGEFLAPSAEKYWGRGREYVAIMNPHEKLLGLSVHETSLFPTIVGLGRDASSQNPLSKYHSTKHYEVHVQHASLDQVPDYGRVHFDFYIIDARPGLVGAVVDAVIEGAVKEQGAIVSIVSKESGLVRRVAELYPNSPLKFARASRYDDVIDPNLSGYFRRFV